MGLLEFLGLGNYVATSSFVASPDLSGLAEAIKSLPPEQQAEYYASFLEEPEWVRRISTGESGWFGEADVSKPRA